MISVFQASIMATPSLQKFAAHIRNAHLCASVAIIQMLLSFKAAPMPTGPGAVPASSAGMHGYTGSGFRVLRQKFDRCKVSTYLGAGGKAWEKWDSVSVLLVESGVGGG